MFSITANILTNPALQLLLSLLPVLGHFRLKINPSIQLYMIPQTKMIQNSYGPSPHHFFFHL